MTTTRCATCGRVIAETPQGWLHAWVVAQDHQATPDNEEAAR